jgi:hypothetical protein
MCLPELSTFPAINHFVVDALCCSWQPAKLPPLRWYFCLCGARPGWRNCSCSCCRICALLSSWRVSWVPGKFDVHITLELKLPVGFSVGTCSYGLLGGPEDMETKMRNSLLMQISHTPTCYCFVLFQKYHQV